jgi:hypothetical protein
MAVLTGTFPPETPCLIFRDAVKTHTGMKDDGWGSYQLSKLQIKHLRNHMIRLYQVLLVNWMAEEVKKVDPPSEMLHTSREMMESGLKDCAFYLKALKTESDRIDHNLKFGRLHLCLPNGTTLRKGRSSMHYRSFNGFCGKSGSPSRPGNLLAIFLMNLSKRSLWDWVHCRLLQSRTQLPRLAHSARGRLP